MTPRPRTFAQGAVDVLCLVGALGFALLPLLEVYGELVALPSLVGGLVLGTAVVAVGAWRRWSAPVVVAALLVVFALAAGPLGAPRTTIGGVIPTGRTVSLVARGVGSTWKRALTLQAPLGGSGVLLLTMLILAYVGAAVAVAIALRVRNRSLATTAAIVPVAGLLAAIVFGMRTPSFPTPVVTGCVLAVVLLGWASWRAGLLRLRRTAAAAFLVVVGIAAGAAGAPVVVGSTDRYVVRDQIVPPFDPRDYPSPLSAFREFVKQDADTPLFTVSGLPDGARVRLATMDRYDGVVWNVSGDGSADASGEFRRVGDTIETSVRGEAAQVSFQIDKLGGVWLPTVGQTTSFQVPDATTTSGLRYNDATGGAVLTGGLTDGLTYTVDVVVPPSPDPTTVGRAPAEDVVQPDPAGVPDIVSITAADVARDAGSPVQIAAALETWLHEKGYFSHGIVDAGDYASLSGHGADRITELLGGEVMVGDGEQYAAAMALMARRMGLPARVVLGFRPGLDADGNPVETSGEPITVTGKDIQAWVEIPFQGYGWIPFDPTPPVEQTPEEKDQEQQSEPDPQVVQPPPPPPAAVTPPDEDTEQPQTDDADPDGDAAPLWQQVGKIAGVVAIPLVLLATPFLVIVLLKVRRRRRRRHRGDPVARVAGGWDEVLDVARDLRRPTGGLATRNESARALASSFEDVPDGAVVASRVGALARSADRAVFSPGAPTSEQVSAYWADVEEAVDAMAHSVGWRRRMRARLSPASLRQAKRRARPARRSKVVS